MILLIIKTKKVQFHGISLPEADLIAYNNDILVVKVPGHSAWVGQNDRIWSPAEYQVFSAQSAISDSNALEISATATQLLSFPARQNEKSKTLADLAMKNLFNLVTLSSEKGEPSESLIRYETDSDDSMFLKE